MRWMLSFTAISGRPTRMGLICPLALSTSTSTGTMDNLSLTIPILRKQHFQVFAIETGKGAIVGSQDGIGQIAFGVLQLQDLFFHRVLGDDAIGKHRLG